MSLIQARGLSVELGGRTILSDVDFHIEPHEIVTIVGPNGSGKSTLVRTLLGIVRPARGTVSTRPGLRVGYVPQSLAIDEGLPLTVSRFLALPHAVSPSRQADVVRRTGISGLESHPVSGLSGGQLQRVLLARALMAKPDLLVLDEPTQGLDQKGTADFYRLVAEVRDTTGCAVLMVSHDLHVVMSASDRVICLNGHVCCEGAPKIVAAAPEYRALFGTGTGGAFALYRHVHDHEHTDHPPHNGHPHDHAEDHAHAHAHDTGKHM